MARFPQILLTALALLAAVPIAAVAAEGDALWSDRFGLPDVDGTVLCAAEFQGSLVIGGRFRLASGVEVRNIARWDGTGWSPLGEGLEGDVASLAVYGGQLVASGRFERSGTRTLRGIASWNGAEWSPLGGGLWLELSQFAVGANALEVSGSLLYAAGDFDRAGGVEARRVARWDGSAWSALGSGLGGGTAYSLLTLGSSLYAGGSFDSAGGAPASGVAKWDGQAWSALGSGVTYAFGGPQVRDMIEYRGALVAAGTFDSAGSQPASNIAAWDGQSWKSLGDALANGILEPLYSLAVVGDTLVASGFGLHAWDGFIWSVPAPYANGWVANLAPTSQGLAVVGRFRGLEPGSLNVAAVNVGLIRGGEWIDPTVWTDRMHGLGGVGNPDVTALESYRGSVVAAGRFLYAGGPIGRVSLGPIAAWDGATWSTLGTPPFGQVTKFLATGDTLYAEGSFASFPVTSRTPVMMYDGANWMALDTLSIVGRSLALFRGELYIGGFAFSSEPPAGVYRWDGVQWKNVAVAANESSPPSVEAMTVFANRLVVAGRFDSIGGVAANGVAAWDGTQWTAMDAGLAQASVRILGVCEGSLYAGGDFFDAQPGSVAQWTGSLWSQLPGLVQQPNSFACANHALYVGGLAIDPHRYDVRGVTKWDGQSWTWLGSGTDGMVLSMAVHQDGLYAGGVFSRAGGKSSSAIARWDLAGERRTSAMLTAESGIPNPFTGSTSIAYRLSSPGHVRVSVFDLRGRRVAVLDDSSRPSGTNVVTWDGHLEGGGEAPAGIYFIRLELPGRTETRRVVRLR